MPACIRLSSDTSPSKRSGDAEALATIDFAYDGDGMRISKTPSGGTTTYYLLDGAEIAEEMTGNNVTSYVGPGLIGKITSSGREIYHPDGIGSTRAMSGSGQTVQTAVLYDAWGNLLADYPSSSAPNFGYSGQYGYYADPTGLDYLKERYYDPETGRYLSRYRASDTGPYDDGVVTYEYADDNPVNIVPMSFVGDMGGWPWQWDNWPPFDRCLRNCFEVISLRRTRAQYTIRFIKWIGVPIWTWEYITKTETIHKRCTSKVIKYTVKVPRLVYKLKKVTGVTSAFFWFWEAGSWTGCRIVCSFPYGRDFYDTY